MIFLFVDTNVLLHYRRLEEIDWLSLANSKEVVIVLCPTVIRELDRLKVSHPQNKFRKRAQEITTSLHTRFFEQGSHLVRSGVRLEFLAKDPLLDFSAHKLRPELGDDWLIASVLEWRQTHTDDETKIVSADLGMSIKARSQGISVLIPLEADKLSEELDPDEKRIRKLQEELAELKNSLPDLTLCFEGSQKVMKSSIERPLPTDQGRIVAEMTQIRSKYPLRPVTEDPQTPAKVIRTAGDLETLQKLFRKGGKVEPVWPREEILRYNRSIEIFFANYETYFKELWHYQNLGRRTIAFEVHLINGGGSPAEDIDIHFHFPDGFQLFEADSEELPKEPQPPKPPPELGTFGFSNPGFDSLRNVGLLGITPRDFGPPPNVSAPSIRRTNSYEVRSHITRAKHGYQLKVAKFVAIFDSFESATSFQIDYTILAGNLPKPATGRLLVVIEKPN